MSPEQTADLAALLADHPWIAAAVPDGSGVRLRPSRAATAVRPALGSLIAEYLEHWGEVYDFTYSAAAGRHAADLDLSGWRASDTGEPFPVEHMADWVDRTVDLVLATRPRYVLELGCGTGLLAHRLRPHLAGYVGTDVARAAVERPTDPSCAYVLAAAHEVAVPAVRDAMARAGFPSTGPDCVLVNSVTQHFPNVAYLTAMVVDAIGLLAPGGTLVVGDIRHAGLLEEHCRWIEATADPDPTTLARRARERAGRDDELNVDPVTLAVAATGARRPVRISVHPKALLADTELTRYRFDAVLRVDPPPSTRSPARPWTTLADLLAALDDGAPVRVEDIPNRLLTNTSGGVTARELRDALTGRDATVLLDTRDPTRLAVVAPASAAADPVAAVAELVPVAHEPFPAFVSRRLGELARTTLRRRHPGAALPPITIDSDPLAAAARAAEAAVDIEDARRMPAFLDDLDQVALLAMSATLGQGWMDGTARLPEEISDALAVAPRHRWILRRWLAALIDAGMLTSDGHTYRDLRPISRTDLDEATKGIDKARRGLGYPPELTRFFQTAVQYLPELLRDEVTLQALLFADGETDTAEGAYRDNTVNRYVNAAAADLIRAHADTLPAGRTFRILEVGAGVGGTTADVLAAVADLPLDYLFTDVSRFFLTDARKRFAGVEGLRFGLFDIDATTGAADRDVVLGANVLHNARDLGATLRGLRELLVPGGLLVFVDTTRELRQILTSMQFLMSARPGHDQPGAGDARASTDRIFLTAAEWTAQLAAAGFDPLGSLPAPGHPLHPVGVHVFAAVRPPE